MAIIVIEGGQPNGADLVVASRRLKEETYPVPVTIDGVDALLVVRAIVDDGRIKYVRSLRLLDLEGRPVREIDKGSLYVEEQELARG
jgi:hypothetical protein